MTTKRLPRSTPEAQGIPSAAIQKFVDAADKTVHDIHSLMVMHHGAVVAEGWWQPFEEERNHVLFSLSKSFTSSAVGLAVDEGLLTVDDPVIDFFPDDLPETISDNLAAMTVYHLLAMFTGHYTCRFDGDSPTVDSALNVAFGPTELPQLVGKAH